MHRDLPERHVDGERPGRNGARHRDEPARVLQRGDSIAGTVRSSHAAPASSRSSSPDQDHVPDPGSVPLLQVPAPIPRTVPLYNTIDNGLNQNPDGVPCVDGDDRVHGQPYGDAHLGAADGLERPAREALIDSSEPPGAGPAAPTHHTEAGSGTSGGLDNAEAIVRARHARGASRRWAVRRSGPTEGAPRGRRRRRDRPRGRAQRLGSLEAWLRPPPDRCTARAHTPASRSRSGTKACDRGSVAMSPSMSGRASSGRPCRIRDSARSPTTSAACSSPTSFTSASASSNIPSASSNLPARDAVAASSVKANSFERPNPRGPEDAQGITQLSCGLVETALEDEYLPDVRVVDGGIHAVADPQEQVAGLSVAVHRLVPAPPEVRVVPEVVHDVPLLGEVTEPLVELERPLRGLLAGRDPEGVFGDVEHVQGVRRGVQLP